MEMVYFNVFSQYTQIQNNDEKSTNRRCKHCALAVVRRTH